MVDLQQEVASLREDVEDLKEPVEEFDLFDQCMFTIGVTQYGDPDGSSGYVYGESGQERRQALAVDMRGFDRPQYDFLSFLGEYARARRAALPRRTRNRGGDAHGAVEEGSGLEEITETPGLDRPLPSNSLYEPDSGRGQNQSLVKW